MEFEFNEILSALNQIRGGIPVKRLSNRIRLGVHRSAMFGPSYDLHDIHEYDPDRDKASDIIWSLYDPSEKIIWVRRTIEAHEVKVNFIVDLSSSLDAGLGLSRRKMLLETIGFLGITASRYQDPVGLIGFTDRIVLNLRPRCGQNNFIYLLKETYDYLNRNGLVNKKHNTRKTDFFCILDFVRKYFDKPCFIPVISDFINLENIIDSPLLKNVAARHELIFIFLDDPLEYSRNSGLGYMSVQNSETGQKTSISRRKIKKLDLELRKERKVLRNKLRSMRIESVVLEPGKHFKRLYKFFQIRHKARTSR